jgi:hypothetical protein
MNVICKRPTKKLVKGLTYEVKNLWNSGNNKMWREGRVEISGIGTFVVDNFTDMNGDPLPKTDIITPIPTFEFLRFEDLKKDDILICTSDEYKTLAKDCMYQIEGKFEISRQLIGWNKQPFTHIEQKIKFVGIDRKIKFNEFRFRKLTAQESREISLNSVLNGEEPLIVKTKDIRKIEMVANKELELMTVISKSITDINRHHLSILDWACQKSGSSLGINTEDFSDILNMSLKDILEKIEK